MSLAMSTALSALTAAQRIAETASHNIANANTPGYSRQVAVLRPSLPIRTTAGLMGTGVTIEGVHAIRDNFLTLRINQQMTGLGYSESMNNVLAELETIIMPSHDVGIGIAIDDFFRAVNELVNNPQSDVSRQGLIHSANMLSETFQTVNFQLRQLQQHTMLDFNQNLAQVNSLLTQVADLNTRILAVSEGTDTANDLTDQRNVMLEDLSRLIPININVTGGVANVLFEGRLLVSGPSSLELTTDSSDGIFKLGIKGSSDIFHTNTGMLGAQAKLINTIIPEYIDIVDDLAKGMIHEFNKVHSTGVGLNNGYTTLSSMVELADLNYDGKKGSEPLAMHSLAFPPEAGRLHITITNNTSGSMHRVYFDYDPEVDSIYDIADKISTLPAMNANVSAGVLTMNSWPGYSFDFSNKLLPNGGVFGTSNIRLSGAYTGTDDRVFTFYPLSSGTVGETADLRVAIIDGTGRTVGVVQVGKDYSPGTPMEVVDGISFAFDAGTLKTASLTGSKQPFELADGMELRLAVNNGSTVKITFRESDFADITQATAAEVAAVIQRAGLPVSVSSSGERLQISPTDVIPFGSIEAGGAAASVLGFPAHGATSTRQIRVLGDSDPGGLLPALGINAFFTGAGSGNMAVSQHIRGNPANIAASKTSPPGDNSNAIRLAQIKHTRFLSNGSQTLGEYYAATVGKAGIDAAQSLRSRETQTALVDNLARQRDSVSGVSLEEEMAKLMQTQQMFYAAVRLINTIDEMLSQLARL